MNYQSVLSCLAGYLADLLTDFYSLYLCIALQCLLLAFVYIVLAKLTNSHLELKQGRLRPANAA